MATEKASTEAEMIASLLSEILEKLDDIARNTGSLAADVEEFRPVARKAVTMFDGSPIDRIRAAMGRTTR